MELSVAFEPLLPWQYVAATAVLVLVLAALGLVLRMRGAPLRLAAGLALIAALANPVILDEEREPLAGVVALVIDRSPSQDLDGRRQQTDAAVARIRQQLQRFPQFELREVEAGTAERAADRTETRLFEALNGLLRDVPPSRVAGAILVTDGQIHDVPEAGNGFLAPLHALITGKEDELDYRIEFVRAPRFAIAGKPLDLTYRISGRAGEVLPVSIAVNGEPVGIARAATGQETRLSLEIPHAGRNIIELAIDPQPDEVSLVNNRAIALVDGIRENLRVLLVSGEPHAGERTWRNLLKSDAAVDLVHFTILRPPEKQDGTPITDLSLIAFPTRELFVEKIHDFDLIIFDRYQHRDVLPVLYYDYIAQYVMQGGALLIAAGPEYAGRDTIARTPLISALPGLPTGEVIERAFYPRLTEIGERHPVTRGLDGSVTEPPQWSRWFRLIGIDEPEGTVVLEGAQGRPLLVLDRIGEGRVGMLLSDQGWLWARGFEGGGPHVSLYRRIAHWLMKEPDLEEERLHAQGRGMTLEIRRQSMAETVGPARFVTPSGAEVEVPLAQVEPGVFAATVDAEEIGLHEIRHGELRTLAHVGPVNAPEFADARSTTQRLAGVARESGGSVRRIGDAEAPSLPGIVPVRRGSQATGRDWIGLGVTSDSTLKSVNRLPLFAGFLGLAALLLALGAMWYREGR